MTERRRQRWIEVCVFCAAWLSFGYFHQGGNWLQNATFAQVRAVVEQGRLAADSFLAYLSADDSRRLMRTDVTGAVFQRRGVTHRLTWPGGEESIDPAVTEGRATPLHLVACSAELVYAAPHFYPRYAPGLTLVASPAYFLVYHVERLAGFDPDDWWVFTVNGWLSTALSVGFISACGAVIFFRVALTLWPTRLAEALAATLTLTFATIYFPDATMLRPENVVAVALLFAFYMVLLAPTLHGARLHGALLGAGLALGIAVTCLYAAIAPALLIGAYYAFAVRSKGAVALTCGFLLPLAVLALCHQASFGSPFRTEYSLPYMMAHEGAWPWSFVQAPHPWRMLTLLVSPFRGLFFTMPVLLAAVAGLWVMARSRERRAVAILAGAILLASLVLACIRREWHGSWCFGPRLLVPALPFLALGLVDAFARARRTTSALAIVTAAVMLAVVSVDAQPFIGVASLAEREDRPTIWREPLSEYILPVLTVELALELLHVQVGQELAKLEATLLEKGATPEAIAAEVELARQRYAKTLERGDGRLGLASYRGPVSANPIGMFEPWPHALFSWREPEPRWHAFNAGELLFPQSRASLLPLLLVGGWLTLVSLALAGGPSHAIRGPSVS